MCAGGVGVVGICINILIGVLYYLLLLYYLVLLLCECVLSVYTLWCCVYALMIDVVGCICVQMFIRMCVYRFLWDGY